MKKSLLFGAALFIFGSIFLSLYSFSNSVSAFPITPGCYKPSQGRDYYTPSSCPVGDGIDFGLFDLDGLSSSQVLEVMRNNNKCYFVDGPGSTNVFDCDDFLLKEVNVAAEPDPAGLGPDDGFSPELQNKANKPIEADCEEEVLSSENCNIILYLVNGINFLTAAAGMVIIFSIMYSGYQYMTARDNSGWVQEARHRIAWALVALLIMIFMYAFLNWIVPGGVLPN